MANVSLPAIVSKLPNDLRNFLQRVRELLVDLDTRSTGTPGETTTIIIGGGGEVDYTPPPAPTGLTAVGSITTVFLQWDDVSASYDNLSHTEIWRSATNNLGTAVLQGTAQGHIYQDTVDPMSTYYYWVRMVSLANVDGPYNAVDGVAGVTSQDPESVIDLLTAHGLYTNTPYYYQATETTINGVAVPIGTYVRDAYISNGAITTAKIGNAQITDAKIDSMTAGKITTGTITGQEITIGVGGNIKSGQTAYNTGTGWWIGKGVDGYSRFSVGSPTGAGFNWSEETGAMHFRGIMALQSGSTIGGISADYIGGWANSLDNTKIDGVNIHADSAILTGSTAPGVGSRYSILSGGDITFYDYYDNNFHPYKSLKSVSTGLCETGVQTNVGYFRNTPKIILSPATLRSYHGSYPNQSQTFVLKSTTPMRIGNNWYFTPICQLQLDTNAVTTGLGVETRSTSMPNYTQVPYYASYPELPANTYHAWASIRLFTKSVVQTTFAGLRTDLITMYVYLQYYTDASGWLSSPAQLVQHYPGGGITNWLSFGVVTADTIRHIRVYVDLNRGGTIHAPTGYSDYNIPPGTTVGQEIQIQITSVTSTLKSTVLSVSGQAMWMAVGE